MNCSKLKLEIVFKGTAIVITPTVVEGAPLNEQDHQELNQVIGCAMEPYYITPQLISSLKQDLHTAILAKWPTLQLEITVDGSSTCHEQRDFGSECVSSIYSEPSSTLTFTFPPTPKDSKPIVCISGSFSIKRLLVDGFSAFHFHGRFSFTGLSLQHETRVPVVGDHGSVYNLYATYDNVQMCAGFVEPDAFDDEDEDEE